MTLAGRLRGLRLERKLTQKTVATALERSVPLISAWESGKEQPPEAKLLQYAMLFAGERSSTEGDLRLPTETELTSAEIEARDRLYRELVALRGHGDAAAAGGPAQPPILRLATTSDTIGGGSWYFGDGRPVTIVCSKLPKDQLALIPDGDPELADDADHRRSYQYADLDALIELYGHIRAVNPASQVNIRVSGDVDEDDVTAHVVLLGGVDWNPLTGQLLARTNLPVRQVGRPGPGAIGYFEAGAGIFEPVVEPESEPRRFVSDVGLFYRGVNPNNALRTLTICNGMFARGTYGVVRALTDTRFRDRNERFVNDKFGGKKAYCILSRVSFVKSLTMTPDWTESSQRLFEWSEPHA